MIAEEITTSPAFSLGIDGAQETMTTEFLIKLFEKKRNLRATTYCLFNEKIILINMNGDMAPYDLNQKLLVNHQTMWDNLSIFKTYGTWGDYEIIQLIQINAGFLRSSQDGNLQINERIFCKNTINTNWIVKQICHWHAMVVFSVLLWRPVHLTDMTSCHQCWLFCMRKKKWF